MAERHTIETYGHTIAGRRRHAWPILLSFILYSNHYSLQRPVPNLQFPAVFPANVSSRTLHRPATTLYSIIIPSHSFSSPGHFSSHVLKPSPIHHCTTSLE